MSLLNIEKALPVGQAGPNGVWFWSNQIRGIAGGRISKPDAVACGTINIVDGTGTTKDKGGPSANQTFNSTSVTVVAAIKVVPATVAIGNGGSGISDPKTEAVGFVVLGKTGNPVGKVLLYGAKETGEKELYGKKGTENTLGNGDQKGLNNGETIWA